MQAALPCFQLVLIVKEHDIHPRNWAVLQSKESSSFGCCNCKSWMKGREELTRKRDIPMQSKALTIARNKKLYNLDLFPSQQTATQNTTGR